MGECRVPVWVNPFTLIFEHDEPTRHPDILLGRLCAFQGLPETSIRGIASLHAEVEKLASEPPIVPHDNGEISAKIVTPLRGAKVTLILGHFVATVALCGVACEMLAVFLLQNLDLRIGTKRIGQERQKALFGSTFKRLQQDRRIRLLHALGVIDEQSRESFDRVRDMRNKYIHLNFNDNKDAKIDAINAYVSSVSLLNRLISAMFRRGKMEMNPVLFAHLKKQGVVVEGEDSSS
jgi:hypothetical protein